MTMRGTDSLTFAFPWEKPEFKVLRRRDLNAFLAPAGPSPVEVLFFDRIGALLW